MVITYYDISCFKIQSGDLVLAFDPPSKEGNGKVPRFQADLVFSSHDHPEHNGIDNLSSKTNEPLFSITGPGEYEIKKISIQGIPSFHDTNRGEKNGLNTIYKLSVEDITLCHLGDFGEKELRSETEEQINGVDVLFIPIGGDSVLDPASANRVINQISPRFVVPMRFDASKKESKQLVDFFDEMGIEKIKPIDKLVLRKKDIIDSDKTKVVVLESTIAK